MPDLDHKTKLQLQDENKELSAKVAALEKELTNVSSDAVQVLGGLREEVEAKDKHIAALNGEVGRLNGMVRHLVGERDQARQALVEGTLNSNKLLVFSQNNNTAAPRN